MAREVSKEMPETRAKLSKRLETSTIAALGDSAATAVPAALQTGQTCVDVGPEIRSAQKWNCAPRKMSARTKANMRMRRAFCCTLLIRWSLGKNGCGVKYSVWG